MTRIQRVSPRRFRDCSRPKSFLEIQIHRDVLYFQFYVHPLILSSHPDRPPMFTSSSAFPVGSSRAFAGPSSRVPGSPGLARTASCDPAHLYTPGPVYTHATQALGSVGSTSHGTVFCHASTGAQTPSPLIEDPSHVPPSLHPTSECFLATITATMEKMSANHDLPPTTGAQV